MLKHIKLKSIALALVAMFAGLGAIFAYQPAYAACTCEKDATGKYVASDDCSEAEKGICASNTGGPEDINVTVKNIINAILYIIGLLAVVMVIIGGVQYTTSGGDSAAVTKAKNTILYGIVGLAIAILAYAIVNFVIGKLLA